MQWQTKAKPTLSISNSDMAQSFSYDSTRQRKSDKDKVSRAEPHNDEQKNTLTDSVMRPNELNSTTKDLSLDQQRTIWAQEEDALMNKPHQQTPPAELTTNCPDTLQTSSTLCLGSLRNEIQKMEHKISENINSMNVSRFDRAMTEGIEKALVADNVGRRMIEKDQEDLKVVGELMIETAKIARHHMGVSRSANKDALAWENKVVELEHIIKKNNITLDPQNIIIETQEQAFEFLLSSDYSKWNDVMKEEKIKIRNKYK